MLSIPAEEAQFISILHKILNAKKTLEIGVFSDYFLLATALALPLDDKVLFLFLFVMHILQRTEKNESKLSYFF